MPGDAVLKNVRRARGAASEKEEETKEASARTVGGEREDREQRRI